MTEPFRRSAPVAAGLAVLAAIGPGALAQQAPPTGAEADVAVLAPGPAAEVAPGVGPVTRLPLPRFVSMRGETANARRGPSLEQRVDWEFRHRGMPLEITGEYGNWRRVRDVEGKGGWVHQALLSGARTALVLGPDRVALREKPEDAARPVAIAEPGVIGRLDTCEGDWCEIAAGTRQGWVPRAVLWGVGPDETID